MGLFRRKQYINLPEVVYELKPGGHYLIEYQKFSISKSAIKKIEEILFGEGITVLFVENPTQYRIFEPVPATVKKPPQ